MSKARARFGLGCSSSVGGRPVIDALSKTLKKILSDPTLATNFSELLASQKVCARPDTSFSAPDSNGINLFLYDIRENLELRDNTPQVKRDGATVQITQPPKRIDCSYLVTAWVTESAGDADELLEHKLLGQALQVLGRFPKIPEVYLEPSLVSQTPILPMMVPKVDGMQGFSDFWSSMGHPFRASFTVTVTISIPTFDPSEFPVVTSIAQDSTPKSLDPKAPLSNDSIVTFGGLVVFDNLGTDMVVHNAQVELVEPAMFASTNVEGIFSFSQVPVGMRKFRAAAVGFESFETDLAVPTANVKFTLQPIT